MDCIVYHRMRSHDGRFSLNTTDSIRAVYVLVASLLRPSHHMVIQKFAMDLWPHKLMNATYAQIHTQKLIETLTWSVIESRRLLFSTQLRRSQFAVKRLRIGRSMFSHIILWSILFFVAIFLCFARSGRMLECGRIFLLHFLPKKAASFNFQ